WAPGPCLGGVPLRALHRHGRCRGDHRFPARPYVGVDSRGLCGCAGDAQPHLPTGAVAVRHGGGLLPRSRDRHAAVDRLPTEVDPAHTTLSPFQPRYQVASSLSSRAMESSEKVSATEGRTVSPVTGNTPSEGEVRRYAPSTC